MQERIRLNVRIILQKGNLSYREPPVQRTNSTENTKDTFSIRRERILNENRKNDEPGLVMGV